MRTRNATTSVIMGENDDIVDVFRRLPAAVSCKNVSFPLNECSLHGMVEHEQGDSY